jgi:hypothetical protein
VSDIEVKIDQAGIAEILRGPDVAAASAAGAAAVVAALPPGVEGYIDYYVTDRAVASVTIASSRGRELKYGDLAAAATRAGLEYRGGR